MKDRYQTIWPNAEKDQALAYAQGLMETLANAPAFAGILSVLEEHVHPDVRAQVRALTDAKSEAEYLANRRLKHLRTSARMTKVVAAQYTVVPDPAPIVMMAPPSPLKPVQVEIATRPRSRPPWPFPLATAPSVDPNKGAIVTNTGLTPQQKMVLLNEREDWFTKIRRSQDRQEINHAYEQVRAIHKQLYPGHP